MTSNQPFGPGGWTPERLGPLDAKTFVITGTTTGTGYEAARLLLSKGAHVVMLNRNAERAARVVETLTHGFPEARLTSVRMDLAELASVRRAAAEVLAVAPQIDALICNAAVAQVARQERTTDGFERHFAVNHLGHFLLCGLLFQRVDASSGRMVMVGSLAYKQQLKRIKFEDIDFDEGYTPWDAYAQSKLAQVMFGYELQRRVRAAGRSVEVHVCHPGAAKTSLIQGEDVSRIVRFFWMFLEPLVAQSAERGAWPEVMCATEPGLKPETFYGPTRRWEMGGPVGEGTLEPLALDREQAARLWSLSEQRTDLQWL